MAGRWTRKRMIWTIVVTVILTVLAAAIAMNFKTPEKEIERKIDHHYSVTDPQFRREMGVLLGPAILSGNRVTDLENGDEIFPAMLEGIRSAQKTITFETYIYWSGKVGQQFADALSERARAGVDVNVTIDWAGSVSMPGGHHPAPIVGTVFSTHSTMESDGLSMVNFDLFSEPPPLAAILMSTVLPGTRS